MNKLSENLNTHPNKGRRYIQNIAICLYILLKCFPFLCTSSYFTLIDENSVCLLLNKYRNSHQRCCIKKAVFKSFAKFTEKHLCERLFFNKVAATAYNSIKKVTLLQVFSCEFCVIFKNTFLTEHIRVTASVNNGV